ncbi:5982_t:CDS:2 [Dentiscutata erythropus]|uniref:5982_t:CDS:1 n=1 Tax=Dentiscutata erythropus TaxID=1348616 RepID=A0A9N9CZ80_9GLOM|nr:5982_t:CDS:2 [Dentiscutata erythropus]
MPKIKSIQFEHYDTNSFRLNLYETCATLEKSKKKNIRVGHVALREEINSENVTRREKLDAQKIALENEKNHLKKVADSLSQECCLLSLEIFSLKNENTFLQSPKSPITPYPKDFSIGKSSIH